VNSFSASIVSGSFSEHFLGLSNSRIFPGLEIELVIFQVFQDVWEPCYLSEEYCPLIVTSFQLEDVYRFAGTAGCCC